MAAVAPSPEQSTELLKNLSLDSQSKAPEIPEPTKKPSSVRYEAGDVGKAVNSTSNRSTTPILQEFADPNMFYVPNGYASSTYYYGGYDGPMNEWEDYPRYVSPDGVEIPPHGVYGDCGNMMYHPGYGYLPCGAYSPCSSVPTVGPDGQLYSPQPYQYVAPYYQHPSPPVGQFDASNQATVINSGISACTAADLGTVPIEPVNGASKNLANDNANGSHGSQPSRPSNQSSPAVNSNGACGKGTLPSIQDPHSNSQGQRSVWVARPVLSNGQHGPVASAPLSSPVSQPTGSRNQNVRSPPHLMGMHPSRPNPVMAPASAFMNRIYPNNRVYNHDTGASRLPYGYGSNGYDSRAHWHGWMPVDSKYKPRGRGNGYLYYSNENIDALNEQNKGPRAARYKNQRGFLSGVTLAAKGQTLNEKSEDSYKAPEREQYNHPEFVTKYTDAKFFVIKSYSEDDIHKSIKYNVWASTPNGNKKLDAAYREASEKASACPVFLLFSVNTSGQFCGLAEMVGPVDFNKNLDYWQQDKWNGCFPVKWHIVKDIPNSLLKHIILENNDNKPVTNSRDTQEVKLEQGLEILKICKEHASKTCMLDDFGFYENRQRQMQESRGKLKQIQKPIWDEKVNTCSAENKDGTKSKSLKPIEPVVILQKETAQVLGEAKSSVENGLATGAGDVAKNAKPATNKRVANGVSRV
ncbi:YTH domain-containing protein ECT4-like isoform X1 [Nymphaea colorata]|nr:YTH domain-containing protein ECT4-like isoform X1 [Nymphaea colorata]